MTENTKASGYSKMVEFIPYKTLSMDLEAVLAGMTKVLINRGDHNMAELIALSDAELYPVGSFDPDAQRYEYVLKLSVPVKYFDHLKSNIDILQRQILSDVALVTSPYLHEFISQVFIVMKIEQDSQWRKAAIESMESSMSTAGSGKPGLADFTFFTADTESSGFAPQMENLLASKGWTVGISPLASLKDRDVLHAFNDLHKTSKFGILILSKEFMNLSFTQNTVDLIAEYVTDPGKKLFQVWDNVSRAEVAAFNAVLARCLACSTERMTVEEITGIMLQSAAYPL